MGKPVEEPRKVYVGIRLTEKEAVQLRGQMEAAGYNSLSRYVRLRALSDRRAVRSNSPLTGRNVRDLLNVITSRVSQAGMDCSRFAGRFEELVSVFRQNGNPESDSRVAMAQMRSMSRSMKEMRQGIDQLLELFIRLDTAADSRMESSSLIINSKEKMLQKIEIIGNLTKDAELKTGHDGMEFIVFRVACTENYKEERRTTYYDVTHPSTKVFDYLKKGRKVYVSGRLSLSLYEKDGQYRMNNRIRATELQLLDSRDGMKEGSQG